jgi:hypothetical protein
MTLAVLYITAQAWFLGALQEPTLLAHGTDSAIRSVVSVKEWLGVENG